MIKWVGGYLSVRQRKEIYKLFEKGCKSNNEYLIIEHNFEDEIIAITLQISNYGLFEMDGKRYFVLPRYMLKRDYVANKIREITAKQPK
jgi:hypothetical protein